MTRNRWIYGVWRGGAASSLAFALAAAPNAVAAQTNAVAVQDDEPSTVGEIVVTAQRRSESSQAVPISITAIDGGNLEALGVRRSEELSIRVPSLTVGNDSNIGQPYIRGIGSQYSFPGLDPSVSIYVDGGYIQRQAGSILEFVDIRNVQVLKGPQGTLYGRNATGGAILIEQTPPDPTGFSGHVSTEFGRFDDWRSQAVVNLPLSDTLAVRFAAQHRERDGYMYNRLTDKDEGGGESDLIRGKLLWEPTSALSVQATVEYFKDAGSYGSLRSRLRGDLCLICTIYGYEPPTEYYDLDGLSNHSESRAYSGNLRIAYEGGRYDLASVTTYRDTRYSAFNDNDFSGPDFLHSLLIETGETFTQEFQFTSKFDGAFNLLLGAFYENDRAAADALFGGDAVAGLPPVQTLNRAELDSYSVYGEAYFDFAPDWRLTGGLRYNRDEKSLRVENSPGGALFGGGAPLTFGVDAAFSDVTPRVVLAYTPGRSNYYISYNKGFKSGGFNTPTFSPVSPLEAENITSLELGAKNSFLGGRLRTDASVFHYWYDDLQVSRVNFDTGGIESQNAASARTTGIEASVDWRVTNAFTIGAAGTYLRARFRDFPDAAAFIPSPTGIGLANGSVDLGGHRLPYSPTFSGSLYGAYRFELEGGWSADLSAVARFTTDYDFAPGANGPLQLDRQEDMTLVNLSGGLNAPAGWRVGFYINNLTDKKYFMSAVTAVYAAEYHPAPPRTYGVSLRYDF